jgi:predicted acetyltransferase
MSYLLSCYNTLAQSRHGMLIRTSASFGHIFEDTQNRIVGCFNEDRLDAYCVFSFKPTMQDTMFQNDIFVKELVYNNPKSLNRILTFLSTQSDQINNIIINTQEEDFYHLFPDPRDGSNRIIPSVYHESNTAGVGIMYRVVDIPGLVNTLFSKVDYDGKLKLKLTLSDSLYLKNSGSYYISFSDNEGSISDDKEPDVELVTDISPFSSLVMGSVRLGSLLRLGLANLSDDKYYPILMRIFSKEEKPICMTPF